MRTKTALVLDDEILRHDAFDKIYGNEYTIYHAYNIAQFINFIHIIPGTIDYVSLDHDLGDTTLFGEEYSPVLRGNGMMAVNILVSCKDYLRPNEVNVHSQNGVMAQRMYEELDKNGYKTTRQTL